MSTTRVQMRAVGGGPTALGSAGPFTLVADRPAEAGGGGRGFNGGQLLYLSIAACFSNDLYREAAARGIVLTDVSIDVEGEFQGPGQTSGPIAVAVTLAGQASEEVLDGLLDEVDRIAEIPNSIRGATPVTVVERRLIGQ